MAEPTKNRFISYFAPVLDALRSVDPTPMRPAEVRAWIQARIEVPAEDLTRLIVNAKQSIFENQVHWARFYLAKATLITSPRRGLWGLTQEGRETHLTPDDSWALFVRVRDANRSAAGDEGEAAAPETEDDADNGVSYWFVGASWDKVDQWPRFLSERIWQNGDDKFSGSVSRMKPGDQIIVKASFVKRRGLPFDVGGKPVSVMRIKAAGTITENLNDGRSVKVAWTTPFKPRDWYFYTYRTTIVEARDDSEEGRRLIEFALRGGVQDYAWFLARPYFSQKYGLHQVPAAAISSPTVSTDTEEADIEETSDEPAPYTIEDLIEEGCFLTVEELATIMSRWRAKKNLVLQGPPGTGKTWLAKRLAYALVGSNDRETDRSRLRVVQFHPSLSYEDFVRGWRPEGEGRLALVDGIMMQAIEAAKSEPDRPFVLVIEEINRGNPAQIFGEMLTLLEDSKRKREEAIELAYRRTPDERVHVPDNLYVIGTMNVADRSLAIVDLALRRRFAFVDLEPMLGVPWRTWCQKQGLDISILNEIERRIGVLNSQITSATSLGPQFRIGHSYVTPTEMVTDGSAWFLAKVETEIGPLLDEYWYDAPETAKDARLKLVDGLA